MRYSVLSDRELVGIITQDILSTFWNIHSKKHSIKNDRQRRNIIHKHSFFHIARENTTLSLASIGAVLGKDHATVLHACRNHESNYKYDPTYRFIYDDMFIEMEDYLIEHGIVPKSVHPSGKGETVRDVHFKLLSVSRRLREKIRDMDALQKSVKMKIKRADKLVEHFSDMQNRIHYLERELKRVKNLL